MNKKTVWLAAGSALIALMTVALSARKSQAQSSKSGQYVCSSFNYGEEANTLNRLCDTSKSFSIAAIPTNNGIYEMGCCVSK